MKRKGFRFPVKGAVAGAVAVLGAAVAAWWLWPEARHPQSASTPISTSLIKEVTPAAAKQEAPKVKQPRTAEELNADFIRRCEARYGDDMPRGLRTHIYYLKNPPKEIYHGMVAYPFLEHPAERAIASVLKVDPGTAFIEPPQYDDRFDKDFISAMLDPIEIKDDDPADVREAKEFVTQMKKEIAALVRETGKKPSELMNEQGQIMYDLGRFEQQLAEDLRAAERNPDLTDDDVKDMFAAANVLRRKKGLEERMIPDLTRRTLNLKRLQRKERQKERNP